MRWTKREHRFNRLLPFVFGLCLALMVIGVPAHALTSTSDTCGQFETWTFSPSLTTTAAPLTTWGVSYNDPCVTATVSTSPPGESVTLPRAKGSFNVALFGNCALALASRGSQTVVVGGSVAIVYKVLSGGTLLLGQVIVARPNAVCNESSASAVGGAGQAERLS